MTRKIEEFIFSPQEAATLTIRTIGQMIKSNENPRTSGLTTGIKDLDAVMTPMRPSDLIVIMGYTSNYKSGVARFIGNNCLGQIDPDNECIVSVTWEQSVEEDTVSWIAINSGISITSLAQGKLSASDWKIVQQTYTKRVQSPLWIVGHSNYKNTVDRKSRPRLSMSEVREACELISHGLTEGDRKIRLIILDYLQRIRPDKGDGDTKREQMLEAVNAAKDLAIAFQCPVILCVQAKREVNDRQDKTPRIDDGQETSNIEQSADKVISVWYPIKTETTKDKVEGHAVTANLLIMKLLKQKMGSAPHIIPVFVDPEKNIIKSLYRPPSYVP